MNNTQPVSVFKQNILGATLLFSAPFIYFYPFSIFTLIASFFLGFVLKKLLFAKPSFLYPLLFALLLVVGIIFSGHRLYTDMAINNVSNSQRGEHSNYQTNLPAKLLHNKSTAIMFYLQNISDRLSISTIFASGTYPNLSKYLPLGFLFPWYLIGFLLSLKRHFRDYLKTTFLIACSALLILTGVLDQSSSTIFAFALVWFINLVSIKEIVKLPQRVVFLILFLNLLHLSVFIQSYKLFLN